jgi:hypothetical protein
VNLTAWPRMVMSAALDVQVPYLAVTSLIMTLRYGKNASACPFNRWN